MSYDLADTIAAIATADGGAARGIVRVSGPRAVEVVGHCFTATDGRPLGDYRWPTAVAGQVALTLDGDAPRRWTSDLFLWPTDRSYTRQPVAELHTLGSPPLLRELLATLCRCGARLAEPGEFTLRAFLAGRIDLTQAEAVLGVIDSEGADELQTALGQLAGGLAKPLQQLREELLHLLAEIEAGLDFVEEDIEFISATELAARLQTALTELRAVTAQLNTRNVNADSYQVVLAGPPNAGKSSLFNAMTERFAAAATPGATVAASAIVSAERGTTRDYLTAAIDMGGASCTLVDTAGVDSSSTMSTSDSARKRRVAEINAAAQALSGEVRKRATLRALCVDASSIDIADLVLEVACDLIVLTKADRLSGPPRQSGSTADVPVVVTSSLTGKGLEELRDTIRDLLASTNRQERGAMVAATADRCRDSLRAADASLACALAIAGCEGGNELVAAELRSALAELGKVVGAVYTDDILDRIFSSFCIGK
jgi:tRNA modification GTPase